MEERELKFRAFNARTRSMAPNVQYCMSFNTDGSIARMHTISIMQFTGLIDKNGKEIYEGDILKLHEDWRGMGEIPQYVYWGNGCWMFQGTAHYTHKNRMTEFAIDRMEIIGNIYENPELL